MMDADARNIALSGPGSPTGGKKKALRKHRGKPTPVSKKLGGTADPWVVRTGLRILEKDRKTFEALD